METNTRTQSLQLLKRKLQASGRRRFKSTHHITAAMEDLTTNQQEEVAGFGAECREQGIRAVQLSQPSLVITSEDTKPPAADTSTTPASCNQADEISATALRREFSDLNRNSTLPTIRQPTALVALSAATPAPFPMKLKSYTKMVIQWSCDICKRECIPIREESRCLCGHRYKEHPSGVDDPRVKSPAGFRAFACTSAKCSCKAFFYVVAEGAWILRCRCKHRHTDHDPSNKPFACKKANCSCQGFDSPWVCNCDHPWGAHRQHRIEKKFDPLQLLQDQFTASELNVVQRTDLLASPLDLRPQLH